MTFRITGLPAADFDHWFALDDAQLAARAARRVVADAAHAFPCRISLTDAAVGDEVLLVNHEHLRVESPYRSRHAIYIRAGERTCNVVDGRDVEAAIVRLFADTRADYLHAHFAKPGCYAARVDRA